MGAYIEVDNVKINNYTFPSVDGGSGNYVISTDGAGNLSFTSVAGLISTFRQSEDLTASKTDFTVTSGYLVGNLDVYYNGFKLRSGDDYTATDGNTFSLSEAAASGDVVEWVGIRYPQAHVALSGAGSNRLLTSDGSTTNIVGQSGLLFDESTFDISANTLRLRSSRTPASSSASGNAGDVCWDSNYLYICVSSNTWKRSSLSSW